MRIWITLLLFLFSVGAFTQNGKGFKKEIKKHRKTYKASFLDEERSPLSKKGTKYLRFFDADPDYLVDCKFEATPNEKPFDLPTYSGITKPYLKYGEITFEIKGQVHHLSVYQSQRLIKIPTYRDHLFIPFNDETNGDLTYGGGRYLDITINEINEEGVLMLDFNKCYNPWCAYSDGFNCPIPPTENRLKTSILAGEKMYAKSKEDEL